MKKILLILCAAGAMLTPGCGDSGKSKAEKSPAFMFWCYRKEVVSSDFHIPEMKTAAAARYLQNMMQTVPGYRRSAYDLTTRTLTVYYLSSTSRQMNFEETIALAGFAVNGRPASPNAHIPEGVK